MKKLSLFPFLTLTVFGMSSCASGTDDRASLEYEKYRLPNGLEVVLHQDTSDPVVSVAIQYHVGSNREKPGKTGFAHFFEHMLFQRSENLPRNAFFQKIDALGGTFNGGTSNDGTVYFETVPRDALEKVLWMESDRMGYFINTVTEGGLKREIDVVSNEKRQGENVPYGLAWDLTFKNLFPQGHPYSWTVIGEIPDLRSATVDDVKEFYDKYYTTSNATLVVAGDFDKAEAKKLIEKYFGEIPDRGKPEAPQVQNVTLDSTKKISYEDVFCNAPMLLLAYPGVETYNEDGYALDFLTNLLAGDKKSPLYKVLVEERKLAPEVEMFSYQLEVAGLIVFDAKTFPGVKLDDVQAAFDGDPAAQSKEEIIFSYPGFFAIFVYRIAHELYVQDVPLIPRIMSEYAHGRTGVDINSGATIGEYFFIDHATGVVIGETTTIGNHVKVYQGVTLGALSTRAGQALSGVKRHPTIEDDVTIYSNASVLGGETVIGEGSIIAGSAFVISSVPAGSRVSLKNQEVNVRTPNKDHAKCWEI